MKSLKFFITVEGLPEHAKDYRVQGDVCSSATLLLREKYRDGAVNVIVMPATGRVLVDADAFTKLRQEARPA